MNALELRGLSKHYKDFSLDHLNLTLPGGCVMGLVGENGAGKSTTIKLILGMLRADGGSVTVLGRPGAADREAVGVVLDEVGVSECLTARQLGKVMAGVYRNWDGAAYDMYLKNLAIPADRRFKEFSRGTKMKLGIAAALSHRAKLLLLDEPTSGLDPVVRDEVTDLFSEFTRDEEHAILISSHIVSDLEKLCDYIAFLHQGRLLLCEEKDRLREEYGVVRCSPAEFRNIDPSAVIGKRESAYGVEAVVQRAALPRGAQCGLVDIEQLFVFMVKGER